MKAALPFALALALAACTDTPAPEPQATTPEPATVVPLGFATEAEADDIAKMVAATNAFAVDLYRAASEDPGNVILGAVSVSGAMGLLYPAAEGPTAAEIADATGFGSVWRDRFANTLGTLLGNLETHISSPEPGTYFDASDPATFGLPPNPAADLSIANAAWVREGYALQPGYANTLRGSFAAPAEPIDFTDPDAAAARINAWVEDRTNDRIEDLVPADAIDPALTAMILTNAVWFKANWADPFDPERTSEGEFTGRDGTTMPATMMADEMPLPHFEEAGLAAAALPYSNPDFRLEVYLPDDIAAFEAELTPQRLVELSAKLTSMGTTDLDIRFPKFKLDGEVALKPALQAVGITSAFDPSAADFPHMLEDVPGEKLYVSDAFHKTFFQVDETSTEAAAATAIVVTLESARLTRPFHVDRPFFTVLRHVPTDAILFLGRVEAVEPVR